MKTLLAIKTCHSFRPRADAQRATWVPQVVGADVKFFVGRGDVRRPTEVLLDVKDDYKSLPHKVKAICQWAVFRGYDGIWLADDDTYINPQRLFAIDTTGHDYLGRVRGPSGGFPAPYCSGFCYYLSKRAMEIIAYATVNDIPEDRWVANVLLKHGINGHLDSRFVIVKSTRNAKNGYNEASRVGNDIVAAGEFPTTMHEIHKEWLTLPSVWKKAPISDQFNRVAVLVKTFLRDGFLFKTLPMIEKYLPGARIIVVDDGYESKKKIELYAAMRLRNHLCAWLPFDSGFCAKSNEGVRQLDRPFMLVASDDFEFNPHTTRDVLKMITVLDHEPTIGVVSGRVDGVPYEGFLKRSPGVIQEIPLGADDFKSIGGIEYKICDITVNYSLVRREVLENEKVHWDEKVKIGGGEHFQFFDQVAQAGWKVAHVRGVNINQLPHSSGMMHPEYAKYRGRAKDTLPYFFKKYNLQQYIAFDGRADVLEPDGRVVSKKLFTPTRPQDSDPDIVPHGSSFYRVKHSLYLSATGEVVDHSHKGSKSLLYKPGKTLSIEKATQLGLLPRTES